MVELAEMGQTKNALSIIRENVLSEEDKVGLINSLSGMVIQNMDSGKPIQGLEDLIRTYEREINA